MQLFFKRGVFIFGPVLLRQRTLLDKMPDRQRFRDTGSGSIEMDSYSQIYNTKSSAPAAKKAFYKSKIFIVAVVFSVTLLVAMTAGFIVHYTHKNTHFIDPIEAARLVAKNLPSVQKEWYERGIGELEKALNRKRNKRRAKNVILFVGDGMGPNTVTAARIMGYSEEGLMSWEQFPDMGLLKVCYELA